MKLLDRNLTEAIYTIAHEGTITKAADTLYISQSALSRRLIIAEKQLGFEIFDRTQKPLRLTAQGRIYLNALMKIGDIYSAMQNEIAKISSNNLRCIRIGMSLSLSRSLTHVFLPQFFEIYPNVEVQLIEASSNMLEDMVSQNVVDIAIVHSHNQNSKELAYKDVVAMPVYLSVPRMYEHYNLLHKGINNTTISLSTLGNYPFVLVKKNLSLRMLADTLFIKNGIDPKIKIETGSIEVAENLARANIGFTIVPVSFTSKENGTYCKIENCSELRPFYLCSRKTMQFDTTIHTLMELISSALIIYASP